MAKKRIILVGKAGSGKDFLRDYLAQEKKLPTDVSYTTRPKRDGEKEGYTYHYIDSQTFDKMQDNGEFFESVKFNGWGYGTSQESWDNNLVFIMTPSGVKQIPPDQLKECTVVYLDIDEDIRKVRLSKRSDADSVDRRLKSDAADFENFKEFNIKIENAFFPNILIAQLTRLVARIENYEV